MKISGAEIIIKSLTDIGVDTIFGYPGGKVLSLYDAFYKQDKIKHILTRHEQGAAHAAEGYARSTGKVGTILVTSGPGATNTVTGLADAYMDSIPLVCFSGQVSTKEIGTDAFQEADISGITRSCTKYNYLVTDIEKLEETIHEAYYIAATGRPGPVMIDVPVDVQNSKTEYKGITEPRRKSYKLSHPADLDMTAIDEAMELIANAKRPIFYVGGGIINSDASEELRQFVQATGYPITQTLMALGAYPAHDSQFIGMVGMHGTVEANMALYECDVMINIGARFDDRVTSAVAKFSPNSKKIHIDIDASSINKCIRVDVPIISDAKTALVEMAKRWKGAKHDISDWWAKIEEWRGQNVPYKQGDDAIKPQYVIEKLSELAEGKDAFFTTDVGQHQMWAAQYLKLDRPRRFMTSGGLGTMGYGMPAAMGVQVANPSASVICISGDSSIMMNIQELATIAQYRLPVKVVVLNNTHMGMVRQWQELFFNEQYSESSISEAMPDLVKLAESFHIRGCRCSSPAEIDAFLADVMAYDGAVLAEIMVCPDENVYPMLPPGAGHNEIKTGV